MITLYGIPNCDTVKKARTWLEQHSVSFEFHDFRKQGLSTSKVEEWLSDIGIDKLINKRSTTWKQLDDAQKAAIMDQSQLELIIQHPTLIKRPVLEGTKNLEVGFKAEQYQQIFSS